MNPSRTVRHARQRSPRRGYSLQMESLEPRLVLSSVCSDLGSPCALEASPTTAPALVFVDSRVEGYQLLVEDLLRSESSSPRDDIQVVILDDDRDGVAQMSEVLSQHTGVAAIHVLSHGSSGSLQLGNTRLTGDSLDDYAAQLSAWGVSLAAGGDILLYGCNVAEGSWGIEFVADLASATGADVAASSNLTGAALLGGDWILEASSGLIESPIFSGEYQGVLFDVCIDDNRCTHEEMTGYAGNVFVANGGTGVNIDKVKEGAGHEDEVDHIYDWHSVPIIPLVTVTHFWDADAGAYAPSFVDGPAAAIGPFPNSWQKAEQYWSLALGAYADGNRDQAYHFLGHIAHHMGDNTIPTHVHVSAHDPVSGDDSMEDWMSQGNSSEPPGSDLLPGEQTFLNSAGPLDIPLIPGRTDTPVGKLYWLMYTTNQIADFFPSDREEGDSVDPEGWVTSELNSMASITTPRTTGDLADNDCNNPLVCIGGLPGDDDNNVDGDLGVIRFASYFRGIRAISSLYELFEETVKQPIAYVKIESVAELDDHDYLCAPICAETSDADFYAKVSIAGQVAQNAGDQRTGETVHPNWTFGQSVGVSGSVPMWIEIWDEDDFANGADDLSNITAGPGRRLDFSVDVATCLTGAAGAVSGGNINGGGGACGQSLTTNADADDDDDGDGIARVTFSVRISNVPPTAEAGGPYTVAEGSSVGLSGADSSDPNQPANTLTYDWDLDNNGSYETTGMTPNFSAAGLDGPSSRTVGLRVTDNGGLTATDTATINITNVNPDLQNVAVTSVNENGTVTLTGNIVDPGTPDTFTLVVNWGEGSPQTFTYGSGTTSFSVTHRYFDDNPSHTAQDTYSISLNLSDDDGGTDTAGVQSTITNVAPLLSSLAATTIDENGTTTLTGIITDPGTQDTFSLAVNWGDPLSPNNVQIIAFPAGTTSFSLTHQYLDDNPSNTPTDQYTIGLTITDDDTGSATGSTSVTVNNLAPIITAQTNGASRSNKAKEGEIVSVGGSFTDVGTLDTHTVETNWGDGTTTAGTVTEVGGSGTFSSGHAFTSGGIFTILSTLKDDDTAIDTASETIFVTGAGIVLVEGKRVLFIVGTDDADVIAVTQNSFQITVTANFLSEASRTRNFDARVIDEIRIFACGGDDRATLAGRISLPALIDGGPGDDTLVASGNQGLAGTVLMGGGGDDVLTGDNGGNILIGGTGKDTLVGLLGDDILHGGYTIYDHNVADDDIVARETALLSILAEWNSSRSLAVRRANITGTGSGASFASRLNGNNFFQLGVTLFDDAEKDTLTGTLGADLFIFFGADFATDFLAILGDVKNF